MTILHSATTHDTMAASRLPSAFVSDQTATYLRAPEQPRQQPEPQVGGCVASDMDERDLLWAAGLLEGEGAFYVSKTKDADRSYPRIRLAMNDRDVVERFAAIVGGCIGSGIWGELSKRPIYFCYVPMSRVIKLAQTLYPHMGIRRKEQIDVLLALPPNVGRGGEHNARHKLTAEEVHQIRAMPTNIRSAAIAKEFGVKWAAINNVRKGKSWRHIE